MKYFEVVFSINTRADILQDVRDVLAAIAGETGFETFEDTDDGIKGYVQMDMFDEDALKASLADFPFDDTKISYSVAEAEYRDWNEQWEQEGFDPIDIDGPYLHCR